jgi:gamma-D-glutamyl-L-lysine dipeptidyl-peptidase
VTLPRFGFCELSLVPVRCTPAHSAEMVTQLLFGEVFKIVERSDNWIKIVNHADNYSGWIHYKQFLPITNKTFQALKKNIECKIVTEMQGAIRSVDGGVVFPIPYGSLLPNIKNGKFSVEGKQFYYSGKSKKIKQKVSRERLIHDALQFLHAPYLWGGKSEFGIDCSGFSQLIFRVNGINLPRDAYQQAELGNELAFVEQGLPGDLAFFDNDSGKIIHVGILLDEKKIIHASGRVRIDAIDKIGIWNKEENNYSHHLRIIKKLV